MAVALSVQHMIRFYSSTDLKNWTKLSDFGPANAVGGVWECPDLFQLPVETQHVNFSGQLESQRDDNCIEEAGQRQDRQAEAARQQVGAGGESEPRRASRAGRALSTLLAISTARNSRPGTSSIPARLRREQFSKILRAVPPLRAWAGPPRGILWVKGQSPGTCLVKAGYPAFSENNW